MNHNKRKNNNNNSRIKWRRDKVQELLVNEYNHYEIANTLQISRPTITRDIQSKVKLRTYIQDKLPEEYQRCLTGINHGIKD
jgi:hypothetical protein